VPSTKITAFTRVRREGRGTREEEGFEGQGTRRMGRDKGEGTRREGEEDMEGKGDDIPLGCYESEWATNDLKNHNRRAE
jgi:hypothetical protein